MAGLRVCDCIFMCIVLEVTNVLSVLVYVLSETAYVPRQNRATCADVLRAAMVA